MGTLSTGGFFASRGSSRSEAVSLFSGILFEVAGVAVLACCSATGYWYLSLCEACGAGSRADPAELPSVVEVVFQISNCRIHVLALGIREALRIEIDLFCIERGVEPPKGGARMGLDTEHPPRTDILPVMLCKHVALKPHLRLLTPTRNSEMSPSDAAFPRLCDHTIPSATVSTYYLVLHGMAVCWV